MRPKENIEEFVKAGRPDVTTSDELDKRTLEDSLTTMEQTMQAKSKPSKIRLMIKLTAAAAVIILAVSFLSTHQNPGKQEQPGIPEVTKSPVEMMTAISLERAFRRGGIEAVENQCDQALKLLGTRTASYSSHELLCNINGS
jgi:hypothetical protein